MIFVYVTHPEKDGAQSLAKLLLENKLIACANIFSVQSFYWWEGKIENDDEYVLILKTQEEKFDKISEFIKKNHPYTVPCIVKIAGQANNDFFHFIKTAISSG